MRPVIAGDYSYVYDPDTGILESYWMPFGRPFEREPNKFTDRTLGNQQFLTEHYPSDYLDSLPDS